MVSSRPRPQVTPGKDPVPILQEAGWAPGPVWTGGKSRPHRDSIPDHPARSQSLYRLSYPAHPDTVSSFIYRLVPFTNFTRCCTSTIALQRKCVCLLHLAYSDFTFYISLPQNGLDRIFRMFFEDNGQTLFQESVTYGICKPPCAIILVA